nr:hypothetical protein [Candidatus Sigynarchaeota archaeon]
MSENKDIILNDLQAIESDEQRKKEVNERLKRIPLKVLSEIQKFLSDYITTIQDSESPSKKEKLKQFLKKVKGGIQAFATVNGIMTFIDLLIPSASISLASIVAFLFKFLG